MVNGKHVADTGSLGKLSRPLLLSKAGRLMEAKVRRQYGDQKFNGVAQGSPVEIQKEGGLQVIYLPTGYSMTPVRFTLPISSRKLMEGTN